MLANEDRTFLKKSTLILLVMKSMALCVAAFGYFNHPHIIRQIDTLGVSLKYFLDWTNPGIGPYMVPSLLTAGDGQGISPTEFPIYNLIHAPFFIFGNYWGFNLARIFSIINALVLLGLSSREWHRHDEKLGLASLMTGVFGVSYLYVFRSMPDFTAFTLCSFSCALIWANNKRWPQALLLGSMGILIKPPAAVAFAIFLIKPALFKELKRITPFVLMMVVPSMIYYVWGIQYIREISDHKEYFNVNGKHPFSSLIEFFSHPKEMFSLLFKDIIPRFSFTLFVLMMIKSVNKPQIFRLILILCIQIMFVGMLDGKHGFIHNYYFIGTSMIVCLIFVEALEFNQMKFLSRLFVAFLFIVNMERSFYSIKTIWKDTTRMECNELLRADPAFRDSLRVRTEKTLYPALGLCLGKIQSSDSAEFGVYPTDKVKNCPSMITKTKQYTLCRF